MAQKYIIQEEKMDIPSKTIIYKRGLASKTLPVILTATETLELEDHRKVYFFRNLSERGLITNTIITGIAVSEEYRDEYNAKCVDVESIRDPELQKRLEGIVGQGKHVSFWFWSEERK